MTDVPNDIRINGPDGSTFIIPVNTSFERTVEINLITDTLSTNLAELTGRAPNVRRRDFKIQGKLTESIDSGDYTDGAVSTNWTNDTIGWDEEFADRVNRWGPNFSSTSTLVVERGGVKREFDGIVTLYKSVQTPDDQTTSIDTIEITIEFTSVDVFYLNAPEQP